MVNLTSVIDLLKQALEVKSKQFQQEITELEVAIKYLTNINSINSNQPSINIFKKPDSEVRQDVDKLMHQCPLCNKEPDLFKSDGSYFVACVPCKIKTKSVSSGSEAIDIWNNMCEQVCREESKYSKPKLPIQKMIEILQAEKECVLRQNSPKCDRDCFHCDLLKTSSDIILTYEELLRILDLIKPINKCDHYQGLKKKYVVFEVGSLDEVENCFVLKPDKDLCAYEALKTYALRTKNATLASDITKWLSLISGTNLSEEENK